MRDARECAQSNSGCYITITLILNYFFYYLYAEVCQFGTRELLLEEGGRGGLSPKYFNHQDYFVVCFALLFKSPYVRYEWIYELIKHVSNLRDT